MLKSGFAKQNMMGLIATLVLGLALGIWTKNTLIEDYLPAEGVVQVDPGYQTIQSTTGGKLVEIGVNNGDIVEQGQLLVRFDQGGIATRLKNTRLQLLQHYALQARLKAEIDGSSEIGEWSAKEYIFTQSQIAEALAEQQRLMRIRQSDLRIRKNIIQENLNQIDAQIQAITAETSASRTQKALLESELWTEEDLLRNGLGHNSRITELRINISELDSIIMTKTSAHLVLTSEKAELFQELERTETVYLSELMTQLQNTEYAILELESQFDQLTLDIENTEIYAPFDAKIDSVDVERPGEVVLASQPIMKLIPLNSLFYVSADVGAEDISKIQVGQQVNIFLSGNRNSFAETITGEVSYVSELPTSAPQQTRKHYRVEIKLLPISEPQIDTVLAHGMILRMGFILDDEFYIPSLLHRLSRVL